MRDDLISRKALLKQFIISDSGRRIPEYDVDKEVKNMTQIE